MRLEPVEQVDALARELDCLARLYQLSIDLDILTFQFILNNILDDGFDIASRAFKLHLKLSKQSLPASRLSSWDLTFSKRISSREESRAREEEESQQSFLQTAAATTATAASEAAVAVAQATITSSAEAAVSSSAAEAAVSSSSAAAATARDFWLLQLGWFAREGARFVCLIVFNCVDQFWHNNFGMLILKM